MFIKRSQGIFIVISLDLIFLNSVGKYFDYYLIILWQEVKNKIFFVKKFLINKNLWRRTQVEIAVERVFADP